MRWTAGILAASLAGACAAPSADARAAAAAAAARRDMADGTARLRVLGTPGWISPLDPETGLLRRADGCLADPVRDAERAAYNAEVLRAIAAGEYVPPFAGRAVDEFEARAVLAQAPPYEDDAPAATPDGRWVVGRVGRDARAGWCGTVVLRRRPPKSAIERILTANDVVAVALDAQERTLLAETHDGTIRTYDAPTDTLLQVFSGSARPR